MMPPVKRRGEDIPDGEPDATYVFSRAEDRSPLLKISYLWDKYRIIIYGVVGYMLATGYEWKTPAQHNKEVKARVDTLHLMIESDRAVRTELERKMDVLIRFRCLEIAEDPKVGALVDLDCDAFLRWRPQPPPTPGDKSRIRPGNYKPSVQEATRESHQTVSRPASSHPDRLASRTVGDSLRD